MLLQLLQRRVPLGHLLLLLAFGLLQRLGLELAQHLGVELAQHLSTPVGPSLDLGQHLGVNVVAEQDSLSLQPGQGLQLLLT